LALEITSKKCWEEKIDHLLASLPVMQDNPQHYRDTTEMIMFRFKAIEGYKWSHNKRIKCHTTLLRPTSAALKAEQDYGLSKVGIPFMSFSTVQH
jgi:hypothetical protein